MTGLSPNALEACPSPGRLKTHRAKGVICPVCEPIAERRDRCPECGRRVTVVGLLVQSHEARRNGWIVGCAGGGTVLPAPDVSERRIGRRVPNRLQRARVLLARGGVA